jgi:hypothetical protein
VSTVEIRISSVAVSFRAMPFIAHLANPVDVVHSTACRAERPYHVMLASLYVV